MSKGQNPPGIERRRFRPYPRYKDSGVKWLGKIPAYWEVKKVKRICLVHRGASPRPIDDPIYFDDEGEYAWVRIADVTASDRYLEQTTQRLSALGKARSVALEPGDLFLSIAATVGKPVITKIKCCIHDGFVYFAGLNENREFLYYLFACDQIYKGLGKLGTQLNLNTDTIGDIYLPIPSGLDQQAIVQFLDRERAKIDSLIEKKERLIELLQEKRTTLITQAVTKGLDPTVPMKDSGVEWLGKIPKHWDLVPLKRCVRLNPDSIKMGPFGSQLLAADMQGEDIKVYNQRTVIDLDFLGGDGFISFQKFHELKAFEVYPDDVLVTTRGTIGRCAIVPENAERGILHPCLMRIQLDRGKLIERFLALLIQESYLVKTQLGLASNATTIDVIYSDTMRQVLVPKPPISEQVAILKRIDERVAEISRLVEMVSGAIDRLKEYHTALISAAVTGKIDVRELARFDNNISPLN